MEITDIARYAAAAARPVRNEAWKNPHCRSQLEKCEADISGAREEGVRGPGSTPATDDLFWPSTRKHA